MKNMMEFTKDFHTLDCIFSTRNLTRYIFNNFVGLPNYERIHPVKQKKVYDIVKMLLEDSVGQHISDIIIFGSATTLFCSSFSDIDMVVLGDFHTFYPTVDLYEVGKVDIFGYNKKQFLRDIGENSFYKNVWEKGVRVYEQLSTPR